MSMLADNVHSGQATPRPGERRTVYSSTWGILSLDWACYKPFYNTYAFGGRGRKEKMLGQENGVILLWVCIHKLQLHWLKVSLSKITTRENADWIV